MFKPCREIIGSVTRTEHIAVSSDDMVDLLSSAFSSIGYWADVDYVEDAYAEAKKSLRSRPQFANEKVICYEEVLTEGLIKGILTLDIHDCEDDRHYQLTLSDIINGIDIYLNLELDADFHEDMDGAMADCIFQCACFGEVIYG